MAAALAILTTWSLVGSARAGSYVIRNCNVPGDGTRTIGPWRVIGGAAIVAHDDCAVGGGFGFTAGDMPPGAQSTVVLAMPPGITIRRVRLWMVGRLAGAGSTMFVVVSGGNATTAFPAEGVFQSPGGDTLSSPYATPLLPDGTTIYEVIFTCSSNAGGCSPSTPKVLDVQGAEATLEESVPPTASIDGGELMREGPQSGVRSLTYTAADGASGVRSVTAMVGKVVVGTVDFGGDCSFAALAACPPARSGSIAVDTTKLPDGIYPVSLRAIDAAGNPETVQAATAIQVSNSGAPTPATPATSPVGGVARLSAAFAANRRATLTAGYGRDVVVRGRLLGPENQPLGGTSLQATERPDSHAEGAKSSVLTTAADGRFSYTIARGTSRGVVFSLGGSTIVEKRLRLRVRAAAVMRVTLGGVLVRYGGRVLSTPLPRRGKLVEIQGRAPGTGWKTFARRRTDRGGGYSGTYRLRVHRPGVHLLFRVRVPEETGYPFVVYAGKAVARIVR